MQSYSLGYLFSLFRRRPLLGAILTRLAHVAIRFIVETLLEAADAVYQLSTVYLQVSVGKRTCMHRLLEKGIGRLLSEVLLR